MSYPQHSYMGAIVPKSTAVFTAEDLSAANAVYGGFLVMKQCRIKAFLFYVTTTISATTNPAVTMSRRPTYNSATGAVLLGTITLPTTTAAGQVMYKLISPTTLYPGDELSFEQTVQASSAGGGFYGFEIELDPEVAPNQTNMVKSA